MGAVTYSKLLDVLTRVACCAETAAHLLRDIAPTESKLFKRDAAIARNTIAKAKVKRGEKIK